MPRFDYDVVILGGGLHGGLTAVALSMLPEQPRVLMIEAAAEIAGNHVWSCHRSDVGEDLPLLDVLPTVRWPGYDVRFPSLARNVPLEYRSIHSSEFAAVVRECSRKAGFETRFGVEAEICDEHHVRPREGGLIAAEWIIDARGRSKDLAQTMVVGWQKFLGLEIECDQPHSSEIPCVMDAVSVEQTGGYHFIYTLPFSPTRILIEDTYYSDGPRLDPDESRRIIRDFAARRSWTIKAVLREEHGALPIPFGRSVEPFVSENPKPTAVGWRGGWFHPTTGYSFGLGIQVAAAVSRCWQGSRARDRTALQRLAAKVRRQGGLARRLNRLLFTAFAPEDRIHVLERFHRVLADDSIARFYSLNMTRGDECRLLVGRPPKGFSGRRWLARWWSGASS